jgi:hypothetical protein
LPKNQDQYADLRRTFGASTHQNMSRLSGASPYRPDAPQQLTGNIKLTETVRVSVRVVRGGKHGS